MPMTYSVSRRANVIINEFYDFEKTAATGDDKWIDVRDAERVDINITNDDATGRSELILSYAPEKPPDSGFVTDLSVAGPTAVGTSRITLGGPAGNFDFYALPTFIKPRIKTAAGAGKKVQFHTHVRRMG